MRHARLRGLVIQDPCIDPFTDIFYRITDFYFHGRGEGHSLQPGQGLLSGIGCHKYKLVVFVHGRSPLPFLLFFISRDQKSSVHVPSVDLEGDGFQSLRVMEGIKRDLCCGRMQQGREFFALEDHGIIRGRDGMADRDMPDGCCGRKG